VHVGDCRKEVDDDGPDHRRDLVFHATLQVPSIRRNAGGS
jgi:hypothetical protein